MKRLAWDGERRKDGGSYKRERSADPYHTNRWTRLSRAWRMMHPLCEECKRRGIIRAGEVTDHIIPWPVCQDFYDENNLQTLCKDCNHAKGQKDKKLIQSYKARQ